MSIQSRIGQQEMQIEQLQVQIDEIVTLANGVEVRLLAQIDALKIQVTELEQAVKEAKRLEAEKAEAMRTDLSDVRAQNRGLAMVVTSLAGRLSSLEPG